VALYARSEVLTLLTMKTLSSGIYKYRLTIGTCYHHILPWRRQQVSRLRTTFLELLRKFHSLRSLSMFNCEMCVTCRMQDKQEKYKHNSCWKAGGMRPLRRPRHRQDSIESISHKYGGRECKSFIWLTAGSEIGFWIQ
jgi:hypothetical protein